MIAAVANTISLVYYLKKEEKSIVNTLFIILNTADLLNCIIAAVTVMAELAIWSTYDFSALSVLYASWETATLTTGFATCILSVARAIVISNPFYEIRRGLVFGIVSIFIVLNMIVTTAFFLDIEYFADILTEVNYNIMFTAQLSSFVLAVVVSSLICSFSLLKSDIRKSMRGRELPQDKEKRHATVTILLVSAIFVTLNLTYVINVLVGDIWSLYDLEGIDKGSGNETMVIVYNVIVALVIPLNSALNPLVYVARSRAMRDYFRDVTRFSLTGTSQSIGDSVRQLKSWASTVSLGAGEENGERTALLAKGVGEETCQHRGGTSGEGGNCDV